MAALRGDHIRHLERDGRVIADIATPVSTTTDPTMQFKGPFDPAISPDGTRVAYTYYWQYKTYGPGCQPPYCTLTRLYHGTGFTDPNRLTAWDEPGFRRRSGWIDASWVDNDTVLLSSPYILPNEDTVLWAPSAPDDSGLKRWFVDNAYYGKLNDVTMSRDKSALASVGNGGAVMNIANAVGGYHPDYPERCAQATADEGNKISSPTFAGDASKLFWAESVDGIHTATLPKFTTKKECPSFTDGGKLLIAGATSPAWGPADVPAAASRAAGSGPEAGADQPVADRSGHDTRWRDGQAERHEGQARRRAQEGPDPEAHGREGRQARGQREVRQDDGRQGDRDRQARRRQGHAEVHGGRQEEAQGQEVRQARHLGGRRQLELHAEEVGGGSAVP